MSALQELAPEAPVIHPIGEPASLGPWTITVSEVIAGEEAWSFLLETNGENPVPPDGLAYVCVRVAAQNTSDQARAVEMVDFAATGSDGVLRRTQAVVVPEPMLQAVVEPGASTEGWLAITVDDPSVATLWFDSPMLGGAWADGVFALGESSVAPIFETLDASSSDSKIGSDPSTPAAIGETVRVGGWHVTIDEVITGLAVFEIADFRYQALGTDDGWVQSAIGLRATVRNLNPFPAFFSTIAFELADFAGEPWDHTLMMTPPEPDVSQEYLPGATGQGWAVFGRQPYAEANLIRIQPVRAGGAARYVIFDGQQPASGGESPADESTPPPALDVSLGDLVETSEDLVRLREEPSASAEVVEELPLGTRLEITGEGSDADGYTWYPVTVVDSSQSGYLVADFIRPVDG